MTKSIFFSIFVNILYPGIGVIYLNKFKMGTSLVIVTFLSRLFYHYIVFDSAWNLTFAFILDCSLIIFSIVYSVLLIKENKTFDIYSFNKWYSCIFLFLILALVHTFLPRNNMTMKYNSESMEPVITKGDHIYASKKKLNFSRGKVTLFNSPKNPGIFLIKRILGIPGDKIEMTNGNLFINGQLQEYKELKNDLWRNNVSVRFKKINLKNRLFQIGENTFETLLNDELVIHGDFEEVLVPKDTFFVLGDNRSYSADSRVLGLIPKSSIIASPKFIFLSPSFTNPFYKFNNKIR